MTSCSVTAQKGFSPAMWLSLFAGLCLAICLALPSGAQAGQTISAACSSQVYQAFSGGSLDEFTKKTGIKVNFDITTSSQAIDRLAAGLCQVAFTAQGLNVRQRHQGLMERPFCKDSLVIITHVQTKVFNLTIPQVRGLFAGDITNWREIGGPDLPVRVIIPSKDTAAYQAFSRMFMDGKDIDYFLMASQSAAAAGATHRYKGAISFVNQAATRGRPAATKIVEIGGLGPGEPGYPYYEIFSVVTRGKANGAAAQLVDYIFSNQGAQIITNRGMIPIR